MANDIYWKAYDAYLKKNFSDAEKFARESKTVEGQRLIDRLHPKPAATPEQQAAYQPSLDAYIAGDYKKALSLAEALKGMPEADNMIMRLKDRSNEKV